MLFIFLGIITVAIIALFAFPKFSPIPYFPSNKKDVELIMRSLTLKSNQMIFDLGAGTGWVIFEAASRAYKRKLNTRFVALELNPILYIMLLCKRQFHKNKKNIRVIHGNMFTFDYTRLLPKFKSEISFYLYISPWHIEKTIAQIQKYRREFYIISYMYAIPHRKELQKLKGKHTVYKYKYA